MAPDHGDPGGHPALAVWRLAALLLAAPLLAIVAVIVATCREVSPLWMGGSVDPSYAYLLNALLVAQGRPAAFVVHPGTHCRPSAPSSCISATRSPAPRSRCRTMS